MGVGGVGGELDTECVSIGVSEDGEKTKSLS